MSPIHAFGVHYYNQAIKRTGRYDQVFHHHEKEPDALNEVIDLRVGVLEVGENDTWFFARLRVRQMANRSVHEKSQENKIIFFMPEDGLQKNHVPTPDIIFLCYLYVVHTYFYFPANIRLLEYYGHSKNKSSVIDLFLIKITRSLNQLSSAKPLYS